MTYLGDAANVIANSLPDASLPGSCVACVAGTFKTALGGEACSPCPADHYCHAARPHLRGGPGMSAALRRMRAPLPRHVCAQTDWCCFRGKMRICVRSVMLTLFTQEILRRLSASVFPCPADTASPARSRSERDCVCKPGLAAEPRGPTAYACAACTAGTFSTAANSSACEACAPKQVLFKCAGCSRSDAG